MRKDNRGISLVEILVVIAIMGVVAAVGLWGLGSLSGRPAQQCAQRIAYSLERHRISSMGKVDAYYTISVDDKGRIIGTEGLRSTATEPATYVETKSELGTNRVKLYYENSAGDRTEVPESGITFKFDRGSGAFQNSYFPCVRLVAVSGGREVKIELVKLTGKVYLD